MPHRTHRHPRVTSVTLIGKAMRIARSTALLLEGPDIDSDCNQACCAMFDAARTAEQSTSLADATRAFMEALR
jgi:hypothetical protein